METKYCILVLLKRGKTISGESLSVTLFLVQKSKEKKQKMKMLITLGLVFSLSISINCQGNSLDQIEAQDCSPLCSEGNVQRSFSRYLRNQAKSYHFFLKLCHIFLNLVI